MVADNTFGKRNLPERKIKEKIIVVYKSSRDIRKMLDEMNYNNNTVYSKYLITPLEITTNVNVVTEKNILKNISKSAYRKEWDEICSIGNELEINSEIIKHFNSITDFIEWYDRI